MSWNCSLCDYRNADSDDICVMCDTKKPRQQRIARVSSRSDRHSKQRKHKGAVITSRARAIFLQPSTTERAEDIDHTLSVNDREQSLRRPSTSITSSIDTLSVCPVYEFSQEESDRNGHHGIMGKWGDRFRRLKAKLEGNHSNKQSAENIASFPCDLTPATHGCSSYKPCPLIAPSDDDDMTSDDGQADYFSDSVEDEDGEDEQMRSRYSLDIFAPFESQLDSILSAINADNIRQCPLNGQSTSHNGSGGNTTMANNASQQQSSNQPTGPTPPDDGKHDDNDNNNGDDEKKRDDDGNNGGAGNNSYIPQSFCTCSQHGCMQREQRLLGLIFKSHQVVDWFVQRAGVSSMPFNNTSTTPIPAQLPTVPVVHIPVSVPPVLVITKSKKKNKKNKAKTKTIPQNVRSRSSSYDPPASCKAQGNVQITKNLTQNVFPNRTHEQFSNLYQYMNRALPFSEEFGMDDDEKYDDPVNVINYGFHDKTTGEELFCVLLPQKERGYKWKMLPRLFTAKELDSEYQISRHKLPKVRQLSPHPAISDNAPQIIQQLSTSIRQTKWSKIAVFAPQRHKNKNKRVTLSLITSEFIKLCVQNITQQLQGKNMSDPIPIIMFSTTEEKKRWIEYVQIIRVSDTVDIGVSFVYDEHMDNVIVTGVHIDKSALLQQHELLLPYHAKECHCLDGFVSNIDDLRIGNLDEDQNRIKDLQRMIEVMKTTNASNVSDAETPISENASLGGLSNSACIV